MIHDVTLQPIESTQNLNTGRLLRCLAHYLSFGGVPVKTQETSVTHEIASILFGSKKTRLGPAPTTEEFEYMANRIGHWVEIGKPIEILTLWGALKGYGLVQTRLDVDVVDIMGLKRYAGLQDQVSQIYEPGLCVKIVRENVGEIALSGESPDLLEKITPYKNSLDNLCHALSLAPHVRFVDESELLAKQGVAQKVFLKQGLQNAELLMNYWWSSASEPNSEKWPDLDTYHKLQENGWNGIIPQETRNHYFRRVSTEYPDMPDVEKIKQVCVYLGNALARVQCGIFNGSYEGADGQIIPPIRTSFVPYPPGTPSALRKARVDFKVKDSKHSNTSIPPWCGYGFMQEKIGVITFEPTTIGVNAYRAFDESMYHPVVMNLVGSNGVAQTFRADVLH